MHPLLAFLPFALGAEPVDTYLSGAFLDHIAQESQGWGSLGVDTGIVPPDGRPPVPLKIRDRAFARGLGCHANSEVAVALDGQFTAFDALIGIQWQNGDTGTVIFRAFVDGEKRFDSGVVREADEAREVHLDLTGADELLLVATDAGDGITCDCADWADARLTRDPNAAPRQRTLFDAAPFARVVTSDPARLDGTHAGRVAEFPAEDVFLTSEILAGNDGTYTVPIVNGKGALGLEWYERRQLRELAVEFAAAAPAVDTGQAEYWSGESPWQGSWKPLPGQTTLDGPRWLLQPAWKEVPDGRHGTFKMRWVFTAAPPAIRRFVARTSSAVSSARVHAELAAPAAGKPAAVELYNGFLGADGVVRQSWDPAQPLETELTYVRPTRASTDRTVLRFRLPAGGCAVAMDDLLADKAAWLPDFGLFLRLDGGPTLAEAKARAEAQPDVLAEVHRRPDQTFEQALAHVHYPLQDNGPTMLSLAADNAKFVVDRDGTAGPYGGGVHPSYTFRLTPRFGDGLNTLGSRHLVGGWLPVPEISAADGALCYRQRAYVVPIGPSPSRWASPKPLAISEYILENLAYAAREVKLTLALAADDQAVTLGAADGRIVVRSGDRLLALGLAPAGLESRVEGRTLTVSGTLQGNRSARLALLLPGWNAGLEELAPLAADPPGIGAVESYWHSLLDGVMQIDIPDPLLGNVIRAAQVHCLMAARNEADGERISAWIASDRYGPLESEAHSIVLGMDLLGWHDFARRSLDFFIQRYNPQGYLTTGYTITGTGWHLWTLAEHHRVAGDDAWLKANAAEVARVCRWIAAQTDKTRKLDPRGDKLPEYGLVPPGVAADWNMYAYRFFVQAHLAAGLADAARELQRVGDPSAPALLEAAARYREDLLASFRWACERTPAMRVAPGRYLPGVAAITHCLGRQADFYPGEDGNRSWAGDVEIGAQHLAVLGLLDAKSREVGWMIDTLEDWWCLQTGMNGYPGEASQADPFNLGGFAKVQPYYARLADLHALRDDPPAYVRSYFNAIPSELNRENLTFWEHFNNAGAWNKTHETGWFLQQTALLFTQARGEELWLAPFVPRQWLADGQRVAVRDAPTPWGPVSYKIRSRVGEGRIEARVEMPARGAPREVVLRLRHPEGKPLQSVMVNGQPWTEFDPAREIVRLAADGRFVEVVASF